MSNSRNSSQTQPKRLDPKEGAAPDPRREYSRPEILRDDSHLDLAMREKLLRQWKLDLDRQIESESEGMSAQDPISARKEGQLASEERRVSDALEFIEQEQRRAEANSSSKV